MSKKTKSRVIRTFIALKVIESQFSQLYELHTYLTGLDKSIRWIAPEKMHLTLAFLGDTPVPLAEKVCQELPEILSHFETSQMTLNRGGAFPNTSRPRVLWIGSNSEDPGSRRLQEVSTTIRRELHRRFAIATEKRAFKAHLTLARLRKRISVTPLLESLDGYLAEKPISILVENIVYYRSTLDPRGAIYTPLTSCKLA